MNEDEEFEEALEVATHDCYDIQPISRVVPRIVTKGMARKAFTLATVDAIHRDSWLPEALALFNTPGLNERQIRRMVKDVLQDEDDILEGDQIAKAADICARTGRLTFSFPQWRFVAQGFDGFSLLERFSFQKLKRSTDVRNPSLPYSDPERDEFGTGFVWHDDEWSVEYRRAYILCACRTPGKEGAILVRNSSHFFGRDRLDAPVYVSDMRMNEEMLQSFDHEMIESGLIFRPLPDYINECDPTDMTDMLDRFGNILDFFDDVDDRLARWMGGYEPAECKTKFPSIRDHFDSLDGQRHVFAFMKHMLDKNKAADKDNPPFYFATIDKTLPPWKPKSALAATPALYEKFQNKPPRLMRAAADKLVLLSGANGDWPLPHSAPPPPSQR